MTDLGGDARVAQTSAFATAGVITTTQELATILRDDIPSADVHVVAEETLCLVSVATARAVESANTEVGSAISAALLELPFLYRDYIVGGTLLDHESDQLDRYTYSQLERVQSFYTAHLLPGQYPGLRTLGDKMVLWMGRVSPPGLVETPKDRLDRLGLVRRVSTHLRLVLEYARQRVDRRSALTSE